MVIAATIGDQRFILDGPVEIQRALIILYRVNLELLQAFPGRWPELYDSGVRWQLESDPRNRIGGERWLTVEELYDGREMADCEDIASARAAELTVAGIPAVPMLEPEENGWHIVVQLYDGSIEDPSTMLGMDRPIDIGRAEVSGRFGQGLRRIVKPLGRVVLGAARQVPVLGQGLDIAEDLYDGARREWGREGDARQVLEADAIYDQDGQLEYVALEDIDEDLEEEVGGIW